MLLNSFCGDRICKWKVQALKIFETIYLSLAYDSAKLPNCAEGSLAKKDTFLGQVGLHGPDFESDTFGVSRLELHK